MNCIKENLNKIDRKATGGNNWGRRHVLAWRAPVGQERPIVALFKAAADYADQHQARFGTPLGDDSFLGPALLQILRGVRLLLNGEMGRLDCGTLDALLFAMLDEAGFSEADKDKI